MSLRLALGVMGMTGMVLAATSAGGQPVLAREDFRVITSDGVEIHVRQVGNGGRSDLEPLILVHGARVAGIGSFDLDVAGGSLAADLALRTGRRIFVMDARNYGGSNRNELMDRPPQASRPLSRAYEVVRDIEAVVQAARQRTGARKAAILGWATGGMWAAYYSSLWPERVSHLVTLNSLYGGSDRHAGLGPGSSSADPSRPDRFRAEIGGYALNDTASLFPSWDRTIPVSEKSAWRDPVVAEAYGRTALASDPQSERLRPPAFRAPLGAIEDSFYQAAGRPLFDSGSITAEVLILRSELDFWSRPEDAERFAHDAAHASSVRLVTLQNATHYVHLDRSEHGRELMLQEIVDFLQYGSQLSRSD